MTFGKRLFDLVLALLLGAVLLVPFTVLLLLLLVKEGRPIFYVAERMKAPGKPFRLWKLRTMTVARSDSALLACQSAPISSELDVSGLTLALPRKLCGPSAPT